MPRPPVSKNLRLLYFVAFVTMFVVGIPILIFYSAGYTLDEAFSLSIRGGIYVFVPEPDTSVFVGNELKKVTGFFQREVLVKNLRPDQYLVLVANDTFWPWAKFVDVERGEVEPLFPLLVPKVIASLEVPETSSRYEAINELFEEEMTATTTTSLAITKIPESLTRRRVKIWLDGNKIFAEWQGSNESAAKYFCDHGGVCTNPVLVFESSSDIGDFSFYPDRNDAILISLNNGIYAVEIDGRQYQNFYPIYRGQSPEFRLSGSVMYVKDGELLSELSLN